MEYKALKTLMESGNGALVVEHLNHCISSLQNEVIDPSLPAEEYKTVSIGKQEALKCLKHMLVPFNEYKSSSVQSRIKQDPLYYSHIPSKKGVV